MGARGPKAKPAIERFWTKVNKNGPAPACAPHLGRCWVWTASLFTNSGYGQFYAGTHASGRKRMTVAHKFIFEHLFGPLPDGLVLDHLCRNRPCVRPNHLEVVTHGININRGDSPSAITVRLGVCKRGHSRTPENIKFNGRTNTCRLCLRDIQREYRAAGKKSVVRYRVTHCKRGHQYLAGSYYPHPNGGRVCKACQKARNRVASE